MSLLLAPSALLPNGWAEDVLIETGANGSLLRVEPNAGDASCERLAGPVVPGMPNLHCHAFQRAMVGLTQRLQPDEASFWTWRQTMYRFLDRLTPEDVEAIATQLYVELLKGGYTSVVEFHYLQHAPGGAPYDDPATLALAIDAAARRAGIGLTLAPVLYLTGGFGSLPLEAGQLRFALGPEQAFELLDRLSAVFAGQPDRRLALAPHSLRAVPAQILSEAAAELRRRDATMPIHIHVAEQVREVRDCLEHHGRRPLRLLSELVPLDDRWCIVHATHLDDDEVELLAMSGAVAGLCPSTEGDLGDGFFRLADHLAAGGKLGIGSDSNVGTAAAAELRLLEYGQRLSMLRRLVSASEATPSCAGRLWRTAVAGGALASGRQVGALAPGYRADLLVLDGALPDLAETTADERLDALVFGPLAGAIRDVMVGGRWQVKEGHHAQEHAAAENYRRALRRLVG